MTLTARIFAGLAAGVFTGLLFGELAADLKIIGDLFIALLQITVLPYILVSLVAGFGRMQAQSARQLAARGALVLLVIWCLALCLVFAASLAFPDLEAAGFFGARIDTPPEQPDLLELYVPANIFYSLSNNLVPAVVLFSILVGVALISVADKSGVLAILDGLAEALTAINRLMVSLTPFGIFAIAAAAAGTMTIEELAQVQVYLVTYIALALFITFWVFPGLVSALSGISFREVLMTFQDTLVTAFATGSQFVVLPQIAENCKTLLRRRGLDSEQAESSIDIIVPVSFNFPSLGKLLVLLFVLFAAWFSDTDLSASQQVSLAFNGLFSLFGSLNVAVPFMLDLLRIPSDLFQLFLVTGIVVGRFGAMLAALHIIVLSVLGTLALTRALRVVPVVLLRYLVITSLGMVLLVVALRAYFAVFVPEPTPREEVLAQMHLLEPRVPARMLGQPELPALAPLRNQRLAHILDSGRLSVGFRPANLPCSYIDPRGELVGFDVEMAHMLAEDLGVELEFAPFNFPELPEALSVGALDIAMSCIASLPDRMTQVAFSRSYLDLNLAFIVPDHQRALFSDLGALRAREDLAISLVSSHYFAPRLRKLLPNARIEMLEAAEDFFTRGQGYELSALVLSAEEGAAYSYRYPSYTVVTSAVGIQIPAGYAMAAGEREMTEFVSAWIDLKRKDRTLEQLYDYWILGGVTRPAAARWSVLKDVLHWVD